MNFNLVLIWICLASGAKVIGNISSSTDIQQITDKDILGRVFGVQSGINSLVVLVSLILISWVSQVIVPAKLIMISGLVGMILLIFHYVHYMILEKIKCQV